MIKYRADDGIRPKIEIVECEDRETATSVFVKGARRSKESAHECYLDSFDGAKAWLLDRAERRVREKRVALQIAQVSLCNARGLKEPRQ